MFMSTSVDAAICLTCLQSSMCGTIQLTVRSQSYICPLGPEEDWHGVVGHGGHWRRWRLEQLQAQQVGVVQQEVAPPDSRIERNEYVLEHNLHPRPR